MQNTKVKAKCGCLYTIISIYLKCLKHNSIKQWFENGKSIPGGKNAEMPLPSLPYPYLHPEKSDAGQQIHCRLQVLQPFTAAGWEVILLTEKGNPVGKHSQIHARLQACAK